MKTEQAVSRIFDRGTKNEDDNERRVVREKFLIQTLQKAAVFRDKLFWDFYFKTESLSPELIDFGKSTVEIIFKGEYGN